MFICDRLYFYFLIYIKGSSYIDFDLPFDLRKYWSPNYQQIKNYSVERPENNKNNKHDPKKETHPRTFMGYKDELLDVPKDKNETLRTFFENLAKQHKERECIKYRTIDKIVKKVKINQENGEKKEFLIPHFGKTIKLSYNDVYNKIKALSKGIRSITGLKSGGKLAMFHSTCSEWMMIAQSCLRSQITITTVYATLGFTALCDAFNETKITTIFTNENELEKIQKLKTKVPTLKYIIYKKKPFMTSKNNKNNKNEESEEEKEERKQFEENKKKLNLKISKESGLKLFSFEEIESIGFSLLKQDNQDEKIEINPKFNDRDHPIMIMYTSGSTGKPKGVCMSSRMILSACYGVSQCFGIWNNSNNDQYLAYLPLAHCLEFMTENFMLLKGACLCYSNSKTLSDKNCYPHGDFKEFQPTSIMGVPRVYESLKKGVLGKVNSNETPQIKKWLFKIAYESKKKALYDGFDTPLWNELVFKKIASLMGNRVKYAFNGGAPCNFNTQEFVRVVFGTPFVNGYGLTESSATGLIQNFTTKPSRKRTKQTGMIVKSCEMKLVSVPEMSYYANDKIPKGEIYMRGPVITKRYYSDEISKDCFEKDGWFKTGDIASFNDDGTVSIIDRKKNLIKLSHGEYIAVEKVESVYMNSPFVAPNGIMAYGTGASNYLIAIVILDENHLRNWRKDNNMEKIKIEDLVSHKKLLKSVKNDFLKQENASTLQPFEKIRKFVLKLDEWTPENGLLTAAQKLKRKNIIQKYQSEIKMMYSEKLN